MIEFRLTQKDGQRDSSWQKVTPSPEVTDWLVEDGDTLTHTSGDRISMWRRVADPVPVIWVQYKDMYEKVNSWHSIPEWDKSYTEYQVFAKAHPGTKLTFKKYLPNDTELVYQVEMPKE